MDPNETLQNLLDALEAHHESRGRADLAQSEREIGRHRDDAETARVEAVECLESLAAWIRRGGFLPTPPTRGGR